jgi:hypothetical protein
MLQAQVSFSVSESGYNSPRSSSIPPLPRVSTALILCKLNNHYEANQKPEIRHTIDYSLLLLYLTPCFSFTLYSYSIEWNRKCLILELQKSSREVDTYCIIQTSYFLYTGPNGSDVCNVLFRRFFLLFLSSRHGFSWIKQNLRAPVTSGTLQ